MRRALTRERVMAGLAAAKHRGHRGARPPALDPERVEQIVSALDGGASKASVCRSFEVPRSTLLDTLVRVGWTGLAAAATMDAPRRGNGGAAVSRPARGKVALPPRPGQDGGAGDGSPESTSHDARR